MSADNDFNAAAPAAGPDKPAPGELTKAVMIEDTTGMFWAVVKSDPEMAEKYYLESAEKLVARDADVNEEKDGLTVLMRVALVNFTNIAALFIKKGARLDERSKGGEGFTALSYAVSVGHVQMVRLLVASGAQDLDLASRTGERLPARGSPEEKEAMEKIIAEEISARVRRLEEKARLDAAAAENVRREMVDYKLDLLRIRAPTLTIRLAPGRGGPHVAR